jgi:hypothetical protein
MYVLTVHIIYYLLFCYYYPYFPLLDPLQEQILSVRGQTSLKKTSIAENYFALK